jgi:hypothetical protein
MIGRVRPYIYEHINAEISSLLDSLDVSGDELKSLIKGIVPEYQFAVSKNASN